MAGTRGTLKGGLKSDITLTAAERPRISFDAALSFAKADAAPAFASEAAVSRR
jgi:hypothetical protein